MLNAYKGATPLFKTMMQDILFPWGKKRELIRWIALLLMAWDHWAAWTDPGDIWMRLPGRVVFPIFALFMGASLARGFSVWHYVKRILPFALIAQIGFIVFFYPTYMGRPIWLYWNILWTLLLGALLTDALRRKQWLTVPAYLFLAFFVDYGIEGVLLIATSTFLALSLNNTYEHNANERNTSKHKTNERNASKHSTDEHNTSKHSTDEHNANKRDTSQTTKQFFPFLFTIYLLNLTIVNFSGFSADSLILSFGAWLIFPLMALVRVLPLGLPRGPWWVAYAFYPAHFVLLYIIKIIVQ